MTLSVLEQYKAKKAAAQATGQAAPAIGPAEAPAALASVVQQEVDNVRAAPEAPPAPAASRSAAPVDESTQPSSLPPPTTGRRTRRTKAEMEAARATLPAGAVSLESPQNSADLDATEALYLLQSLLIPGCVLTIGPRPA